MGTVTTPASRPPPATSRARLAWGGRLALSGGLLGWLLSRSDIAHIAQLVRGLPPLLLVTSFCISLAAMFLSSLKWKLLLPSQPVGLLFRLNLVGLFYSMILPGQIAGEIVKAYRLGKGHQDVELVAASVVLDRATGLIGLMMIGIMGASLSPRLPDSSVGLALAGVFAFGSGCLLALRWDRLYALAGTLLNRAAHWIPRAGPIFRELGAFLAAWRGYLHRPGIVLAAVAIAIALQLIHVYVITLLAAPLGIRVAVMDWLWIFAVVSVAVVMPISLGGIGVREGAFVGILALLGVVSERALALSLTIFALQLAAAMLGAVLEIAGVRRRD